MVRKKYFFLVLSLVIAFACTTNKSMEKKDILASDLDTTVNPADDFFDYANGGWIKKNPIPAEESSWGIGNLVVEENLKRLREISEEAAKANVAQEAHNKRSVIFGAAAMDTAKIEREGIKPLQPYLDKIAAINDVKNLQTTMAELDNIGVDGVMGFDVQQDAKHSDVYALQLWQAGIGLPEREFYFKTDSTSEAIRNAYVKHISTILTMLGEESTHADSSSKKIMQLETAACKEPSQG